MGFDGDLMRRGAASSSVYVRRLAILCRPESRGGVFPTAFLCVMAQAIIPALNAINK